MAISSTVSVMMREREIPGFVHKAMKKRCRSDKDKENQRMSKPTRDGCRKHLQYDSTSEGGQGQIQSPNSSVLNARKNGQCESSALCSDVQGRSVPQLHDHPAFSRCYGNSILEGDVGVCTGEDVAPVTNQ